MPNFVTGVRLIFHGNANGKHYLVGGKVVFPFVVSAGSLEKLRQFHVAFAIGSQDLRNRSQGD
jgi:hypothetical protein